MVIGEFDVEILGDLIAEGYGVQKLLDKFTTIYERNLPEEPYTVGGDELIGEFDVEILRDLIAEGYEGQKLLDKFATTRAKVPAAMEMMFNDIIAQNNGKTYTLEECFSDDETD